ncbi:A/G-specific adenine glycosylase [Georgenia faecalis]|uniref:Adenine DNA glycosylase n=1 Tax=Georgenia faecalis TaxID=2483799 RepID=A0ABV9D831_9MICO|nr:A/G-specific adenine glycosylase [Georgenia faecalis]
MRTEELRDAVLTWFGHHARDLAWRRPGTSAWGVLVSEVMAQQTPVARVEPAWREWMERWPTPADLAAAEDADVLRAWGRLGYPRRALRLRACAAAVVERHGGVVPVDEADLLALPGVGAYTAAAVRAFAHGRHAVVLDTNVRRVLARILAGLALPGPAPTREEVRAAHALVPADDAGSARWNVAVMELGALVCTARAPRCEACPVASACRWYAAGRPANAAPRRPQAWTGSDRQARGRLMAVLRELPDDARLGRADLLAVLPGTDVDQPARALASLVADGLVAEHAGVDGTGADADGTEYALPSRRRQEVAP